MTDNRTPENGDFASYTDRQDPTLDGQDSARSDDSFADFQDTQGYDEKSYDDSFGGSDTAFPDDDGRDGDRMGLINRDDSDVEEDRVEEDEDNGKGKKGKKKAKAKSGGSSGKSKGPLLIIGLLALGIIGGVLWYAASLLGFTGQKEEVVERQQPQIVIGEDERTTRQDKSTMFDVPMDGASEPVAVTSVNAAAVDEPIVLPPIGGETVADAASSAAALAASASANAASAAKQAAKAASAAADVAEAVIPPIVAGGAITSTNPEVAKAAREEQAREQAMVAAEKKPVVRKAVKKPAQKKPVKKVASKPAGTSAVASGSTLAGTTLMSIYPKSGQHQQAWVQLEDGRLRVVRAGDVVAGKRVTRVDGANNVVYTTGGAIR